MTENMEDVRDAVAKALFEKDVADPWGYSPYNTPTWQGAPGHTARRYLSRADAALSALAAMGLAVVPLATLEASITTIERADTDEGVCCCGSPMENHGYDNGHSPVDAGGYHADIVLHRLRLAASPLAASPDQAAPPAAKDTADE